MLYLRTSIIRSTKYYVLQPLALSSYRKHAHSLESYERLLGAYGSTVLPSYGSNGTAHVHPCVVGTGDAHALKIGNSSANRTTHVHPCVVGAGDAHALKTGKSSAKQDNKSGTPLSTTTIISPIYIHETLLVEHKHDLLANS